MLILSSCGTEQMEKPIYQSKSFTLFKDKVIQGDNIAEVISPTHLKSNYKSPASTTFSRLVKFKFRHHMTKDNELPFRGLYHWLHASMKNTNPPLFLSEKNLYMLSGSTRNLPSY